MGDSSGSISIDVERIFFGGKVRAQAPLLDFLPTFGFGRLWFEFVTGFLLCSLSPVALLDG
jgi:hypothetical protein